ncbi:hypothetical protein [Pelosinus fermentans]|uniref:Uncharacterized protein n=1 Tax=Pelosinus fermentans JBW45 TaxID=1192197 RepID=I9NPD1_9FIRM|nr:hypothetical protein [Pelosinus fermentans]AJQ26172.1 hypothetical protein JBW_00820 [Pelosinus fermentans JBW45]
MYEVDQYTVSLLHFDGGLTDESGKVWAAQNGATVSTTQSKFGGSSLYLNGINQCLTTPNNTDFDFGSGDFTIEGWVCPASTGKWGGVIVSKWYSAGEGSNSWSVSI